MYGETSLALEKQTMIDRVTREETKNTKNIPENAFLLNVKLLLHGVHYIQSG